MTQNEMPKIEAITPPEQGRSMVEMLGTLAIMGVLSIGGIAGYGYAVDKHRANETINDVNSRGIDLVRQVATNQTLSLSEWPSISKAGYHVSSPQLSAEGDAYFSISGVPERVCRLVYEGIKNNQTTDIEINGYLAEDFSACDKENDNVMGFFFITNAGEGGETPEDLCKNVTCPRGSSCAYGFCMSEEIPQLHSAGHKSCTKDSECAECEYCNYGSCTNKSDGSTCVDGMCYNGKCVLDDSTCTTHEECDSGYFCDFVGRNASNKCVKLEFYKTPIKGVYISKKATYIDEICDLAGFYMPTKEQMLQLTATLGNSIALSALFSTSDAGPCDYSGFCPGDGSRHALCLNEKDIEIQIETRTIQNEQTETITFFETTTGTETPTATETPTETQTPTVLLEETISG